MFSWNSRRICYPCSTGERQENIHFTFKCSFVNELKIDQSISHNGVCLTVVDLTDDTYTVTAMKETLERSNLGLLKVGDKVNVERSMMMNGRLDGHIVPRTCGPDRYLRGYKGCGWKLVFHVQICI